MFNFFFCNQSNPRLTIKVNKIAIIGIPVSFIVRALGIFAELEFKLRSVFGVLELSSSILALTLYL